MDVLLHNHGAKQIYKVPEGLRELCTDISREVLRSQPRKIYDFIAEYADTLLITRENTKVAVQLVNNILLGSQAILNILYRTGLSLEQIAIAAPRIQSAFREYLDAVDTQPIQICKDHSCDEKSRVSIRIILESTGTTRDDAEHAATIIQAAFRGHYERMALNEAQGKIQWQKAVANTLTILKKAGASPAEISKSARLIKYAYRGYYTRRNQKMDIPDIEDEQEKGERVVQPMETIQAVAWMEMMYEDSGLTIEKANEAALVIQKAYKRYRVRRGCYDVQRLESTKSMVVEAILENLRQRLFERVMSREDIPEEYGTREDLMSDGAKLQHAFKDHLRRTRISDEGHLEHGAIEEGELEEEKDAIYETEFDVEAQAPRSGLESKSEAERTEEQSSESKVDVTQMSDSETIPQDLMETRELQSESETESDRLEEAEGVPHESINAGTPAIEEQEAENGQEHEHEENAE